MDSSLTRVDLPPDLLNKPAEILNLILDAALKNGASDIHIEPQDEVTTMRLRVDGDMIEWARLEKKYFDAIINRIKFLCGIDFSVTDKISEGRFTHIYNSKTIHFRLSIIPTPNGQDLVLRVLQTGPQFTSIDDAGLPKELAQQLRDAVFHDNGLVLMTGPTGSGKTTTLFAAVHELNDGTRKIITLEDPIEYKIPGVTQIKLHSKIGLGYAQILKTTLRHDPDVIMIGETRDLEAAEIALQASMTGHMVLTTLHTNTAAGSIARLLNLGVSPVDLSNSLTAAFSQHLLKRLCPHCSQEVVVPDHLKRLVPSHYVVPQKMYQAVGCEKCLNGYKGRIPLAEIVVIDDEFRELIIKNPRQAELYDAIRKKGIKTQMNYGLMLASDGIVSLEDVLRTTSA